MRLQDQILDLSGGAFTDLRFPCFGDLEGSGVLLRRQSAFYCNLAVSHPVT